MSTETLAESERRYDQRMEESRLEYNRQAEEYNRKFNELIELEKETTAAVSDN